LTGVACFAATACVAVGYYETASASREGLLVADRAGTVAAAAAPLPTNPASDPGAVLQAVSCGSATGCVALGAYESSAGDHLGVIDTSSSGHWGAHEAPMPTGSNPTSPSPVIEGVDCGGATSCLAVGWYYDSSSEKQGLALVEQTGRWSASMMPGTEGTSPVVGAVSCASATICAAAGAYTLSGRHLGYVMAMSGTSLSGSTAPVPSDASPNPGEDLSSIACPAPDACAATGTYIEVDHSSVDLPVVVAQ
jgi:hypothetical protein